MQTWDQGTRRIYENLSAGFRDSIHLNRPVRKVYRHGTHVVVEDEDGVLETFDQVILACNANQSLMLLDQPTMLERYILSSVRYDRELHNGKQSSIGMPLSSQRTTVQALRHQEQLHIEQYGAKPDNYEVTYIMHNQQPWAGRSDKPCLVTYNPVSRIDEQKIVGRWWFQHVVHDVRQVALLVPLFRLIPRQATDMAIVAPTRSSTARRPASSAGWRPPRGSARTIPSTTRTRAAHSPLREHPARLAVQKGEVGGRGGIPASARGRRGAWKGWPTAPFSEFHASIHDGCCQARWGLRARKQYSGVKMPVLPPAT